MIGDSKNQSDSKFYVAGISSGRLPCNPNSVSVYYPARKILDEFRDSFGGNVCGTQRSSLELNSVTFLFLIVAALITLVELILLCCICYCCGGSKENKATPVESKVPTPLENKAQQSNRVQSKPTAVPAAVPSSVPAASPAKSKDTLAVKSQAKSSLAFNSKRASKTKS